MSSGPEHDPPQDELFVAEAVVDVPVKQGLSTGCVISIVLSLLFGLGVFVIAAAAVGVYLIQRQSAEYASLGYFDDLYEETPAQIDNDYRTRNPEDAAARTKDLTSSFTGDDSTLSGERLRPFQELLDKTTATSPSTEDAHYDLARYSDICGAMGLEPSMAFFLSQGNLTNLQGRFASFDIVDIKQGVQATDFVIYAYAWDTDQIGYLIRVWAARSGESLRIFDWEDVEDGIRSSEFEVYFNREVMGGAHVRIVQEIAALSGQLEGADEETQHAIQKRAHEIQEELAQFESPLAEPVKVRAMFLLNSLGDDDRAIILAEQINNAPGKDSTLSYMLKSIGRNLQAIEYADRFNANVGAFPEVSIDRVQANLSLVEPYSDPEQLQQDLDLLARYVHRSERVKSAFERGAAQWAPEMLLAEFKNSDDPLKAMETFWESYSWTATPRTIELIGDWLENEVLSSPSHSLLLAKVLRRLDRDEEAVSVLVDLNQSLADLEVSESDEEQALLADVRDTLAVGLRDQERFIEAIEVDPDPLWCLELSLDQWLTNASSSGPRNSDVAIPSAVEEMLTAYNEREPDERLQIYAQGRAHFIFGDYKTANQAWTNLLDQAIEASEDEREAFPDFESDLIALWHIEERPAEDYFVLEDLDSDWLYSALSTGFYRGRSVDWCRKIIEQLQADEGRDQSYRDWVAELEIIEGRWDAADQMMAESIVQLDEGYEATALEQLRALFWVLRGETANGYVAMGKSQQAFDQLLSAVIQKERFDQLEPLVAARFPQRPPNSPGIEAWMDRAYYLDDYQQLAELMDIDPELLSEDKQQALPRMRLTTELNLDRAQAALETWKAQPYAAQVISEGLLFQMALGQTDTELLRQQACITGDWISSVEYYGIDKWMEANQFRQMAREVTPKYPDTQRWFNLTLLLEDDFSESAWNDVVRRLETLADEGTEVVSHASKYDDEVDSWKFTMAGTTMVVTLRNETLDWSGEMPASGIERVGKHKCYVVIDAVLSVDRSWHSDSAWLHAVNAFAIAAAVDPESKALALLKADSETMAYEPKLCEQWRLHTGQCNWGRDLKVTVAEERYRYATAEQWQTELASNDTEESQPLSDTEIAERLVGRTVYIDTFQLAGEQLPCEVIAVEQDADGDWRAKVRPTYDSHRHAWILTGVEYWADLSRLLPYQSKEVAEPTLDRNSDDPKSEVKSRRRTTNSM